MNFDITLLLYLAAKACGINYMSWIGLLC